MISRRRLLQTGLTLAALPAWAGAANNAASNAAAGVGKGPANGAQNGSPNGTPSAAQNAAQNAAQTADALKAATGPNWAPWTGPTLPLVLPDLGGREQKLSAWRGSVVIVSFWATWCEPCRDELPVLSTMAKRHREEGLRLVAVNVGEAPAKISAFLKKTPINGTVLHDRNSAASKKWEAAALPANYLVDRAGTIRFWHLGELNWKSHEIGGVVTRMLRS